MLLMSITGSALIVRMYTGLCQVMACLVQESLSLSDSADTTLKLVPSGDNHDPQNDDGIAKDVIFQSVSEGDKINYEQFTVSHAG